MKFIPPPLPPPSQPPPSVTTGSHIGKLHQFHHHNQHRAGGFNPRRGDQMSMKSGVGSRISYVPSVVTSKGIDLMNVWSSLAEETHSTMNPR